MYEEQIAYGNTVRAMSLMNYSAVPGDRMKHKYRKSVALHYRNLYKPYTKQDDKCHIKYSRDRRKGRQKMREEDRKIKTKKQEKCLISLARDFKKAAFVCKEEVENSCP